MKQKTKYARGCFSPSRWMEFCWNLGKGIRFCGARASFQRNAGLFAIAREGCLSGLQRVS